MAPDKPAKKAARTDPRFISVVKAFAKDRNVSHGEGKGFGSGALKVDGKIFAMMSSRGQFVVKLPQERVREVVNTGEGENFDTGSGRVMKEWVVIRGSRVDWKQIAKEACQFVRARSVSK